MLPKLATVRPEYLAAFGEIVRRIAGALANAPRAALPVRMIVAGGAAVHFYTGERISRDIDAAFSQRLLLPENLEVAYRDADGAARLLYFDRQYSDSLSLLHEDAQDDSIPFAIAGIDAHVLDVRLLTPLDLAVSKLSRFSSQDRADIEALARFGLVSSTGLRARALEALVAYVGSVDRVRTTIELAARIVCEIEKLHPK